MSGESVAATTGEDLVEALKDAADEVFAALSGTESTLVDRRGAGRRDRPGEILGAGERPCPVEYEAIVEFAGPCSGALILRAGHGGAAEIARGLGMSGGGHQVDAEDAAYALGECAHELTVRALDGAGCHTLCPPLSGARVEHRFDRHVGGLVYRLARSSASVEIWLGRAAGTAGDQAGPDRGAGRGTTP